MTKVTFNYFAENATLKKMEACVLKALKNSHKHQWVAREKYDRALPSEMNPSYRGPERIISGYVCACGDKEYVDLKTVDKYILSC